MPPLEANRRRQIREDKAFERKPADREGYIPLEDKGSVSLPTNRPATYGTTLTRRVQ